MKLSALLVFMVIAVTANTATAAAKPAPASCVSETKHLASGLTVFRDCSDAPEMIALGGGRYRMGDLVGDGQPYERPIHEVRIAPVAVGRFEVTQAEWQACVNSGGCTPAQLPADEQHSRYPVTGITWTQARAYADWLSTRTDKAYRLLSEAEWEYVARVGNEGRYPWGTFDPDICNYTNLLDASGKRAHPEHYWAEKCDDHFATAAPVGSFPANAWGFHDMLGNVWEWVADCWHEDYSEAPDTAAAWLSGTCRKRVNRGGGWGNNAKALRLSSRDADPADVHSDGLGFRVARTLTGNEIAQHAATAPDKRITNVEPVRLTRAQLKQLAAPSATNAAAPAQPAVVTSLALERQLDVRITVQGTQSWKNVLQHTQGSTRQDYLLSTHLRSDGVLYGDNLLDPNVDRRLSIKQQYLARHGLIRLKALNGGKLAHDARELAALSGRAQAEGRNCDRDEQCIRESAERMAALNALRNNSVEDLEALIAAPASGDAARWLYFTGYSGCPNQIRIISETHIAGERAFDKKKTRLLPWSLDRTANSSGSAAERASLCQRYTVTVDIRSGEVYVENLFIPSPRGLTLRKIDKTVERIEEDLPVAAEVLTWSTARLRRTTESANLAETLSASLPFDGDSTVLGRFDGRLAVTMRWSFKPVAGAALARIPPPTP